MYLDGINDLKRTLELYDIDTDKSCFSIQNTLWLRATIPIHVALTYIRTAAVQSLRGTGNLLGGIFLLDGRRILMGLNDYLSLLVQAVVLPVLGFIAFLAPKTGYQILRAFCKIDTERDGGTRVRLESRDDYKTFGFPARRKVTDVMMGVMGCVSAVVQTVTGTVERLVDLRIMGDDSVWKNIRDDVAPLIAFSLTAPFTDDNDNAYLAHRIYKYA